MEKQAFHPLVYKQSHLNHAMLFFGFVAISIFSLWATVNFSWTLQPIGAIPIGPNGLNVYLPMFGIFPLILLALLLRSLYDKKLVLCEDYLLYLEGLASWKERSVRIDYRNIREVTIEQTLYQKLFGIGDILVTSLSTHIDSSIRMPGVKRPRDIKNFIMERVKEEIDRG